MLFWAAQSLFLGETTPPSVHVVLMMLTITPSPHLLIASPPQATGMSTGH